MSSTETGIHKVIDIEIEPVMRHEGGAIRWQRILLHMEDGSTHRVVAYLHPTATGVSAVPKRRVEDVPRQPSLIPE